MSEIDEPLPALPKKAEKTVYICNFSEDVWPFIGALSNKKRALEIEAKAQSILSAFS